MQQSGTEQGNEVSRDIRAGQGEKRGHFTAVVRDDFGFTEDYVQSQEDVDECIQKAQAP